MTGYELKLYLLDHLGEYDINHLKEAKKLVQKVYEYHYGDSHKRRQLRRLERALKCLEDLIENP